MKIVIHEEKHPLLVFVSLFHIKTRFIFNLLKQYHNYKVDTYNKVAFNSPEIYTPVSHSLYKPSSSITLTRNKTTLNEQL